MSFAVFSASLATNASADAATGGPGQESHFDIARKDCVGTAHNRDSKVWYTIADGALSDVYSPTIDNTNLKSLQLIVTDGSSFTDLQRRDMSYNVSATDLTGMACRVSYKNEKHGYRLVATYITDPHHDSVLVHARLKPLPSDKNSTNDYKVYVRYNPLINGNGGGGSDNGGADSAVSNPNYLVAYDKTATSEATNRDYAVPLAGALRANKPFMSTESGFVGTQSDGLKQLDNAKHLTADTNKAKSGNVVQTARVNVSDSGQFTLALGFGNTQDDAVDTAGASLNQSFNYVYRQYLAGWRQYDHTLDNPPNHIPNLNLIQDRTLAKTYWLSANVLKSSESKKYPGAIVAGLGSPWGQAVSAASKSNGKAVYFGSYREVFSRDLFEAFSGLMAAGDKKTAKDTVRFLFERQQLPNGRLPRNSLLNGKKAPDTGGNQLDETADPIVMALQAGLGSDSQLYKNHIKQAADYLVAHGPSDGLERWEEQSGYSPSTIADEIAGLIAAGQIAEQNNDAKSARLYRATADHFQRSIKKWDVTTNGPYGDGKYFLRLSKNGDPNEKVSYNLGNGSITTDQRRVVDAGFLELARLGIFPAADPAIRESLGVVDKYLRRNTDSGPGFYRYGTSKKGSEDGYGDCWEPDATSCSPTGSPWPPTDKGSGHVWPVLSGERAEYEILAGNRDTAANLLWGMYEFSSGIGLIPEQAWENPDLGAAPYGADPTTASIGFQNGKPAGSSAPLSWAQAQFLRLIPAVASGKLEEQPSAVASRYLQTPPKPTSVKLTSPDDGASVSGKTTTVSGKAAAGSKVTIQSTNKSTNQTSNVTTTVNADGTFSADLPTSNGNNVITAGTSKQDANTSGYDQISVNSSNLPGQTLLDIADPTGDDNGPGTYAYPTADDFKSGAFDLTHMQVIDTGQKIAFRIKIGNIESTFGQVFGAQLLDIYIHDPAASAYSQNPIALGRNYKIAADSAWSQAIEVQGFADPVFQDAQGNSAGSVAFNTNADTGTVTILVPKSAFASQPSSDWKVAVVLTGQDGNQGNNARNFAQTPKQYLFGVCASADSNNPICSKVGPKHSEPAPRAVDVFPPSDVNQNAELNPLMGNNGAVVAGVPLNG